MIVSQRFIQRVIRVHGDKGTAWVKSLPETVRFCEKRWQFKVLQPFGLSYNFVVPVILEDGSHAVLKLCIPGKDCLNEINALRYYEDKDTGMCRLIDSVKEAGILLLERLVPGYHLGSVKNDEEAVRIAASIILKMKQKKGYHQFSFPSVEGFDAELIKIRDHQWNGSSPFSEKLLSRVRAILHDLLSSQKNTYLLHGDLHHENILAADGGWKLVDPKGITGETEYEIIPFVINNLPDQNMKEAIDDRIRKFGAEMDINIERAYAWGLCHSLLATWWNIEDNLGVRERSLAIIKIFDKKVP